MLRRIFLIIFLFSFITKVSFAQKDTLVYYLTANGDLAPSRQAAYCKLVVFPVGSGSAAKLSAIKAIGIDGKPIFSGSSSSHGFPFHAEGLLTEYYPDGSKKSVKTFSNGFAVGDEKQFYPNGNMKSSLVPNNAGDADKMEYFEDGTLSFEHHPAANHLFNETYYYPGGKIERKLSEEDAGVNQTEYYMNGKIKSVETPANKGKKSIKTAYFPNGNIYYKYEKVYNQSRVRMIYTECRDSTGKALAENGNGHWVEYDDNFTFKTKEGKIANGLADSVWTILFWRGNGEHDTYNKGKLISSDEFTTKDTTPGVAEEGAPAFPGGREALYKFLAKNIRYPAIARENNTQGRVVVSFIVEKDGTLSDIRIVSGIGDGCDDEVVRVIKMSPPWVPGTKTGIPARVGYAMPVHFWLSQDGMSGGIKTEVN